MDVFFTQAAGDAMRRSGDLEEEYDVLVAAGGDGTLNEVVAGLKNPSMVPLIQLPLGTANILARELRLPFRPLESAAVIHAKKIRNIDIGLVGSRKFLMVASAGYDAAVTEDLSRTRVGKLGFHGYVSPVLRVLRRFPTPELSVSVDGGQPVSGAWVLVSKTKNYGGLFTLAEHAEVDSGEFEVLVFEKAALWDIAKYAFWGFFQGGVSHRKGVRRLQGKTVAIDATSPVPIQVDGDFYGFAPVEFSLAKQRIPVIIP